VVTLVGPKDVITAKLTEAGVKHDVFDWEAARVEYARKHAIKSILKAEEKKAEEAAKKKEEGK
jgi:hypothetical protein